MPTNDEIIVKLLQKVLSKDEKDHIRHSTFIAFVQMLNEARSDTAKRIFEELDKIMNRHLNSSPIEDIDTADELRLEEDYLTLKRKYKVD